MTMGNHTMPKGKWKGCHSVIRFATHEPPMLQVENAMIHNAYNTCLQHSKVDPQRSTPTLNPQTIKRPISRVAAAAESYFSFCSSPIRGGLLLLVLGFPSRDWLLLRRRSPSLRLDSMTLNISLRPLYASTSFPRMLMLILS
jgi:hypothetical protein